MQAFLIVVAVCYGLLIGSFLNAWAYRLANGERITAGRSHCPKCGAQIRAYDNIPLVSWLLLRGRCRDCAEPISWRYPLGEAITAVLFAAVTELDSILPKDKAARMKAVAPLYDTMPRQEFEALTAELFKGYAP
ncbi:MAG TPA: prepilin peptidase [Candidatus Limnocylindrales bacterium]